MRLGTSLRRSGTRSTNSCSCDRHHWPSICAFPWLATAAAALATAFGIAQVIVPDRLELIVQLVDQGHAGGNV